MLYRVIAKSKTNQRPVIEFTGLGRIKAWVKARALRASVPIYDYVVVEDILALQRKRNRL